MLHGSRGGRDGEAGRTGQNLAQMWAKSFQACFRLCSLKPAHVQSQGMANTSGKIQLTPTCHIKPQVLGITSSYYKVTLKWGAYFFSSASPRAFMNAEFIFPNGRM